MGQNDPFASLGISVHDIESKKVFASKMCMEQTCVILTKVEKFGLRILRFRKTKSWIKTKRVQNDPLRRYNVDDVYHEPSFF